MNDALYEIDGDRVIPSEWTTGPWDPGAQHGGPPSALLGRAIDRLDPEGLRVARVTIELLRPVPVAPLRLETRVTRPGKRVQLAEAVLLDGDAPVARASGWRIRSQDGAAPAEAIGPLPHPTPESLEPLRIPEGAPRVFATSIEWRPARGSWNEPGPAAMWGRLGVPLVAGEDTPPLARALAIADFGNGISRTVSFQTHLFINTELTVHLVREPADDWVLIDAVSRYAPDGIGLAQSTLWDRHGMVGAGAQALLVGTRE